ncbi:T9SS type A sorting domain-containing protein [Adhaeribacter rhizoryzae]|nr:T9SS type A sorting domain-containing protein [Adhaeribacter rhizoryzae]
MKKSLRLLLLLVAFIPFQVLAEGSKQLTPNKSTSALTDPNNDKSGYLAHDANLPSASGVSISSLSFLKPAGFSRNGATYSKDHRLYIRVKAGESMYYGVHRAIHDQTSASQGKLVITIRRTNAATGVDDAAYSVSTTLNNDLASTRGMLLVANQFGVIDNATEADNGPNRGSIGGKPAVTTGYTPLVINNNIVNGVAIDYDYYVEFTQVGEANMADETRFSVYDFWDFTVIDATGTERQGRMRSKLWAFSAGGATNVFSRNFNMFPLVPSDDQPGKFFVKKVELAGIAPQNFFRFVTNSMGTNSGATLEEKRKSQNSQQDYPEYFSFVNNPDITEWPSVATPTFNVSLVNSCNTSTNGGKTLFNINSSDRSTLIVLINLNGVAGYQPGTKDVLLEQSGPKGLRTLEWNGLDGTGVVVAKNANISYSFRNGCAPINFPVWDAEVNNGFRVEDVRPVAGSNYNSLLFWDDRNLSTTLFPVPQMELFGAAAPSGSTTGIHNWGSTTSTATNYNAGDLKTVNTWTYGYTNTLDQVSTFNYDCSADLAVTNTVNAGPYTIGKSLTYTVTVTNNGPIAATNVAVTDLLDATKLQFVSASDAAYNSSTGLWTVGSLANGASRTLTITAKPLVIGAIATTATQTHTEPDNVTGNNAATATITVVSAADISVTNNTSQKIYQNGDQVTYTITAQNLGPNAATNVVVNSKLPEAFVTNTITFVPPAGTSYNATTGVWTIGNLALNELKTLTITGVVSQLGAITTTASLGDRTGFQLDEQAGNNIASQTITVNPAADVAVTSLASNQAPNQNEVVAYTVTVVNNGPNSATDVKVANQIPAGLTITSFEATAGTYDAATGTWTVGTLINAGQQTLTLYAKPTTTGPLTLTATQTHTEFDRVNENNSVTTTLTAAATADVALTHTVTPPANGTNYTNEPVTYTIRVTNNGPSAATNVIVTDQLPASLTYNSAVTSAGTGTYNPATGTWQVGNLANGASAMLTINATINQSAVITTTASQTHTEYDNINGNNKATASIQSGSGVITADINVLTTANASTYFTGEEVIFTVRATNQGPDGATNLTLSAPLPTGFTFVSGTPKIGTYNQNTGIWSIPLLASGGFTELTLIGKPVPDATVTTNKNYAFTAAISGTLNQYENDVTDNTHTTNITVKKNADVSTSMTVTSNSPDGNYYHNLTEATFAITVANLGPDRVTNLVGKDSRTGKIDFTGFTAPAGTTYNPATGFWAVGTLESGETKTLVVKGIPNTTGRMNLGGEVYAADQPDSRVENNKTLALLNVLPVADVIVTNTAPANFNNGENITFTVKVQNNGPDAATSLKIEDVLPAGLNLVSANPSSGTYQNGIWSLGTDLLPGAGNAQTLTLTVKPQAAATYSTTAKVLSVNEYDPTITNNSQTAQVQGILTADIALSNTLQAGPYYVGEKYSLTIKATNLGPDPATGVVIGAAVAPGMIMVPGSGTPDVGTSIDPATGIWTIGNLGVNETKNLTMLVQPTLTGTQNNLGFKKSANEYDPNGGNTSSGNNSTVITLVVQDRPATAQVLLNNKHWFYFKTGQHIALITDPDGPVQTTRFLGGTKDGIAITALPAGIRLDANGELEVDYRFAIKPGNYSLTIESVDTNGGTTQHQINYQVSGDWDQDGVEDEIDLDDNNDGVITEAGAVNPTGDDDNDGIWNFLDKDFIHPVYGAFRDRNGDDINDAFDMDLDGLIRGYDVDIDGDGIPNVIEAYGGKIPPGNIYDPLTGTIKGGVNEFGIPLAILKPGTNNQSILPALDSDGDSRRDYEDVDSDNDGILDNVEAQLTNPFIGRSGQDSDLDGLDNAYDVTCGCSTAGIAITPINTDKTDNLDYLDLDSDNDGSADYIEAFDDNQDGTSLDDLKTRAAAFENSQNKNYYTTADANNNGAPNWLELIDGIPGFLKYGSAYYHDTDKNGLVDLFDNLSGGRAVNLQTNSSDNQYSFRSVIAPVVLPVTLVSFSGKYEQGQVLLNWVTASEKNNSYFAVERSHDGNIFNEIGRQAGAGTSIQVTRYAFRDAKASAGVHYYRLKQVDFDGTFEYSKTIAVTVTNQKSESVQVNLFPNPAREYINLNLSELPQEKVLVEMISLDGKILNQTEVAGGMEQRIKIQNLAAGHYLVRIRYAAFVKTLHLIKE